MAVFVSGLMIGCATTSVASDFFYMKYEYHDFGSEGDFYLYTDSQTAVQYIVITNSDGIGITPRYNSDGSLVTK